MADFVQVSTATETREQAVELARSVVTGRLAAGAQIVGPVVSVFWHEGEFGTGEEWQLLLKTRNDRYADLEAHLIDHHPWKNPEVAAVPLVAGSAAYLRWVSTTVGEAPGD
ncbi:divalent-cation tolerance protein CutA [Streptomyces sp. BH104]|uniref:divalent-cation tolerance protein CutA n=1 Tax=Streptomyces sp. BH104 TaxID=3410407 RepID=UPI003BB5D01A